MAKQNVTFIERHIEKIVVGVCGAVLAGAIAMYGIRSPNRVTAGGESLGPSEFYGQFREKGEQALKSMQSARAPDFTEKDKETRKVLDGLKPPDYSKIPDQIAIAFTLPGPPVPVVGGPVDGKKDLAQIIAPSKPIPSAGRAFVNLLPPAPIIGDVANPTAPPAPAIAGPQDTHWITLAFTMNRKGQREKFAAAEYNEDHRALIVTGIEAQRQMLLPGGEWGPVEKVTAYAPAVTPPVLTLQIPDGQDAEPFIASEQLNLLETFNKRIADYSLQSDLFLRPAVQKMLLDSKSWWWEWSIPRKLEGVDGDLTKDYGVLYPDEILPKKTRHAAPAVAAVKAPPKPPAGVPAGGRGGARGEGGGAGAAPVAAARPAAPPEDKTLNRDIQDYFKKAEKALNEDNPLTAEKFLKLIVELPAAPDHQKKKAQKTLDEIKGQIEVAIKENEAKELRRQERMRLNFGPDIDPCWLTDTSVVPGKTYRYQIRLRALNSYAGQPSKLNQPKDSERVELLGDWSDWSDPITAKPDKEVFVVAMDGEKTAQIEIQRWTAGEWKAVTANKVGLGDPIVGKSGRLVIPYDGTIAGIDQNRPYRPRKTKDNNVEYGDAVPSTAVILVNSKGEANEHLVKEDSDRRTRFNTQKLEEINRIKDLSELQPSTELPRGGMSPGMPGMPGLTPGRGEGERGFPPPLPVQGAGRNQG